ETAVLSYVHERAFAGVVKQAVLPDAGDQDVGKAVVVIVSDRHAHAVHLDIQPGFTGDVGEGSITVVAIQGQRASPAFVGRPVHSVDEQNVLPAIAIEVEKGTTRA